MTQSQFKRAISKDNQSEDMFNYLFVAAFLMIGFYWLFHFQVEGANVSKIILRILAIVLPFVFAGSMMRGIVRNGIIISIESDLPIASKEELLEQYLNTKKEYKVLSHKNESIERVEYFTDFGIPLYLYAYLGDDKIFLNVRRRDNFSIKEIFDFGLTYRARKKIKQFFDEKLNA